MMAGLQLRNDQMKSSKLESVDYQNYHLCRPRMKELIWTHMLIW